MMIRFFIGLLVISFIHTVQSYAQDDNATETLFLNARKHFTQKQYNEALKFLQEASELSPEKSAVWLMLGKTQEQLGRDREAQISFGIAASTLQTELEQSEDHKNRRAILLRILQTYDQLETLPKETLGYIKEIRKIDKDISPKLALLEVKAHFQANNFDKAIQLGEPLLQQHKDRLDVDQLRYLIIEAAAAKADFVTVGKHYKEIKNEKYLQKLQYISPDHWYALGYAYFFFYEWTQGHQFLERALQVNPEYTKARVLFNNLLQQEEERKEAISHSHKRIIELDERVHDAKYFGDLSRLYLLENNYRAAVRAADSCLAIAPESFEVLYLKGIAYYKNKENDEAIATFEELIQHTAGRVPEEKKYQYYFALGMAYKRAQPEKAPLAFEQAQGMYADAARYERLPKKP
ncbi:MAG: tetratricopeptide repeat protein [Bernardetiaceae bacterium]